MTNIALMFRKDNDRVAEIKVLENIVNVKFNVFLHSVGFLDNTRK